MNRVLVTGGAGFIGSTLVDRLIDNGVHVSIVDNFSTGKRENINPAAYCWEEDLSTIDIQELAKFMKGVDTVFHFAATPQVQYSIENPTDNNNLHSLINILEASKLSKVKRFVFSSSAAVYGNPKYTPIDEKHPTDPLSPYALHKLIGEQYCKLYSNVYDLDTVCLRYFNVYGKRMANEGAYKSVLSVFKEQSNNNIPLTIVNDGEQKRDFVHVNDVVQANILAASHTTKHNANIFNVGTGLGYTVNQIANMFGGNKRYGEERIEPKDSIADIAKINSELNWQSIEVLKKEIESKLI